VPICRRRVSLHGRTNRKRRLIDETTFQKRTSINDDDDDDGNAMQMKRTRQRPSSSCARHFAHVFITVGKGRLCINTNIEPIECVCSSRVQRTQRMRNGTFRRRESIVARPARLNSEHVNETFETLSMPKENIDQTRTTLTGKRSSSTVTFNRDRTRTRRFVRVK
jgi:hypothetical protein